MSWPGVREIVGLLLFVTAIGVAATFLDPSKTTGGGEPRPIAHGREVSATTVTSEASTPAATEPLRPMPAPDEWTVLYVEVLPGGSDQVVSRATVAAVDFTHEGAPMPEMKDDGWRLIAEAQVELPSAGRFFMVIEHDAEVRVFIDGRETAYQQSPEGPRQVTVTFHHEGGPVRVRVEATDSAGGFLLRIR